MPIDSKECFAALTEDGQLWEIYQAAQTGGGGVTSVTATSPITSSGGATPNISTSIATNKVVGRSTAGAGVMEELTPVGITVSGGNITGIGGTTGIVDNVVPRANGTGGYTIQDSGLIIDDAIVSFAVTGDAATDIITATGSAFANDQPVRFTSLTGGTGLNTTTNYYVINASGATFQVSTSVGGPASLFTSNITAGTLLNGHSVSVNVTISENTSATNSALVLTPKGTGAFIIGPKPDGTTSGGDARGTNAVDLQVQRSGSWQVASGQNSLVAGQGNTASALNCIAMGRLCSSSNSSAYGTIAMGDMSTASNNASIAIGRSNSASGSSATALGFAGTASGTAAMTFGFSAVANREGMLAYANGNYANNGSSSVGDAQVVKFVVRGKTTTNSAVDLAGGAGGAVFIGIPSGKVMSCLINISGVKSDGSAVAHYIRQYAVKNVGGTSSEVYAPVTIGTDNAAGTTIALSANNTDDTLRIAVTGIAAETWRWVASVDAVEIAYGT